MSVWKRTHQVVAPVGEAGRCQIKTIHTVSSVFKLFGSQSCSIVIVCCRIYQKLTHTRSTETKTDIYIYIERERGTEKARKRAREKERKTVGESGRHRFICKFVYKSTYTHIQREIVTSVAIAPALAIFICIRNICSLIRYLLCGTYIRYCSRGARCFLDGARCFLIRPEQGPKKGQQQGRYNCYTGPYVCRPCVLVCRPDS